MNKVFFSTKRLPSLGDLSSGPGCSTNSRMEARSFWGIRVLFRGLLAIGFLLAGFPLAAAAGVGEVPGEALNFSPDRPKQDRPEQAHQKSGEALTGIPKQAYRASALPAPAKLGAAPTTTQSHHLAHSQAHSQSHSLQGAVLNAGAFDPQGRRPPFFRTLGLRYQSPYGGRESQIELGLMSSLLETQQGALYLQASGLYRSSELGANVGLGYRLDLVQGLQVGVNAFYDWLDAPGIQRASGGVEAKTWLVDISTNFYDALGSEDLSADKKNVYHGLDGWDVQLRGRLPWFSWLEAEVRHYQWNQRFGARDLEGNEYKLLFKPIQLFQINLSYDTPENFSVDWGVSFALQYEFGRSWREHLRTGVTPQDSQDLLSRRFERPTRQYQQRQYQQAVIPTSAPTDE